MTKFKILTEGYAYEESKDSFFASPTCIFLESNGVKVLVDPGADAPKLNDALKKHEIQINDIDYIFLSHWHPDHVLNIRMFPQTDIIDAETIWKSNGQEIFHRSNVIPKTELEFLPTPGHTMDHMSLKFEVDGEIFIIAQDVFWWVDGHQPENLSEKELLDLTDPFSSNPEVQKESRLLVLDIADWIIPGHGRMFKNPRNK